MGGALPSHPPPTDRLWSVLLILEYQTHTRTLQNYKCLKYMYSPKCQRMTRDQIRRVPSIGAGGYVPPQSPRWEGGTAVEVSANAFTLYIHFTNGNRFVKPDFC